jgi:hypothetical protein
MIIPPPPPSSSDGGAIIIIPPPTQKPTRWSWNNNYSFTYFRPPGHGSLPLTLESSLTAPNPIAACPNPERAGPITWLKPCDDLAPLYYYCKAGHHQGVYPHLAATSSSWYAKHSWMPSHQSCLPRKHLIAGQPHPPTWFHDHPSCYSY